jgi:hypothetical protein
MSSQLEKHKRPVLNATKGVYQRLAIVDKRILCKIDVGLRPISFEVSRTY